VTHALLVDWYTRASDEDLRVRYLHAAAHHANQAVELASGRPSPAVLWFASETLQPVSHTALEFCMQYKAVWAAMQTRNKQIEKETGKAQKKMMKDVHRYSCANVECEIQADTGKMLSQCESALCVIMLMTCFLTPVEQVLVNAILIRSLATVVKSKLFHVSMFCH
jgi:hypothetical protein